MGCRCRADCPWCSRCTTVLRWWPVNSDCTERVPDRLQFARDRNKYRNAHSEVNIPPGYSTQRKYFLLLRA